MTPLPALPARRDARVASHGVAPGPYGTARTVGDGAYAWFDGTDWIVTPADFATSSPRTLTCYMELHRTT